MKDETKNILNWSAIALSAGFGLGNLLSAKADYQLNGREVITAAFARGDSEKRKEAMVREFAEVDFTKILAEQETENRQEFIDLLSQNPDAIKNLELLAGQYQSLARESKAKLMERVGVNPTESELGRE